jgi:hypothetical protein
MDHCRLHPPRRAVHGRSGSNVESSAEPTPSTLATGPVAGEPESPRIRHNAVTVRYVVELHQIADVVQGQVTRQGSTEPEQFTGWLELLRLLERAGDAPGCDDRAHIGGRSGARSPAARMVVPRIGPTGASQRPPDRNTGRELQRRVPPVRAGAHRLPLRARPGRPADRPRPHPRDRRLRQRDPAPIGRIRVTQPGVEPPRGQCPPTYPRRRSSLQGQRSRFICRQPAHRASFAG